MKIKAFHSKFGRKKYARVDKSLPILSSYYPSNSNRTDTSHSLSIRKCTSGERRKKSLTRNRFTFGSQLYRKIQFKRVTRTAESNPKAIQNHATLALPNWREKWKRIFYI